MDGMALAATATGEYTATVTLNDATDDGQWSGYCWGARRRLGGGRERL